MHPRAGVKCLA